MSKLTVKGYNIIEKIGTGAFSEVFFVRCRRTGKCYAAKHLIDECSNLEDDVAFSEIQLMKSVPSHPHLNNIVDYVHENNRLTLILSLMDMSLFQYMQTRARPFSEKRVRKMLFQIVQGLEYLHQNGIFHRDIKPENILVKIIGGGTTDKREILQLADFGSVARIMDDPPRTMYIATRWYRAPECMLTMGYYGPKMDIWAVGCCFYEMVTHKPLFKGENEVQMLDEIHKILGSPSKDKLYRFKNLNPKNLGYQKRSPVDFRVHLPLMNAYGIDLIKKTLAYYPDQRICAKKLLSHVYFEDLIKHKKVSKFSLSHQNLNMITNETSSTAEISSLSWSARKLYKVSQASSVASSNITNNTFHFLSNEEQYRKNRKLERFWNMNPKCTEKCKPAHCTRPSS
ncbi:MAPK/MAK/MRK overlapping kinase-like [Anopheles nili]|uniref:MAPK/MAK/MRK overlapping kinase-like n=1 Tax=Anopheles nili TaxID=185578 RepID=UPI00237A453A|nr:MAPK/MAK/MRK overlapping kinase-like [Anopheles nili]